MKFSLPNLNKTSIIKLHLIFIFFSLLLQSCSKYDNNGNLYFEHLEEKEETYYDVVHPSLWFPVKKTRGPYMYLDEEKYTGSVVKYNKTILEFEGYYSEGIKNGIWKYYYNNGNIKKIITFKYGEERSRKEYNKNGDILLGQTNNMLSSKPSEIKKYDKEYYSDGKKTGIWKKFYPNDSLKATRTYENDKLNGVSLEYYESGKLKIKGYYSQDKANGSWEFYYENGKLQRLETYLDNVLHGKFKTFYKNGSIKAIGRYEKGKKAGKWEEYHSIGTLKSETEY